MRQLVIAVLSAWAASAQTVASPGEIPTVQKLLQTTPDENAFRCDVDSSKAELNFGLRFQAGYVMQSKWGLLANLVKGEFRSQEPSDIVLFLGPRVGPLDKMPGPFPRR
ncbi:MAG TPA: hypothetical protein VMB03_27455 [Bryobacteraceae bacterium]|nr:hypothetical protein [Bryobacteraceae bacterium]